MSGQVDPTLEEDVAAQILVLRPKLRHLAVRLTNNWADAEDLVQLAMVKALEFRGRLWRNTNLKAWLRTVMHHQVIDESRRARRRAPWAHQLEQLPAPEQRRPDEPGEVLWEDLSSDDVRQALARCPGPAARPVRAAAVPGAVAVGDRRDPGRPAGDGRHPPVPGAGAPAPAARDSGFPLRLKRRSRAVE